MSADVAPDGRPGRYFHALADGRLQCDLCPRDCTLAPDQRGLCFVRQNIDGQMWLTTWGRSSGFCIDPIEKKPLNHYLPGSSVLSFGTAGCNLTCRFCQNWDISKSRAMDRLQDAAAPEAIARAAVQHGARSVAYTYNDPVIFAEYAVDVAAACRAVGVRSVAVTAGYVHEAPRRDFFAAMDAANVDLKAFTEGFYRDVCGASLAAVKDTLRYLVRETRVWTEITTLLIPGLNDGDAEIDDLAGFVATELSPDVPVHFSAFHPDYKMTDRPGTPPETLRRARARALAAGLHHVYTGNVHDADGDTTFCPGCREPVIVRDWYRMLRYALDDRGACRACGAVLPGVFDGPVGTFGARRIPIRLSA